MFCSGWWTDAHSTVRPLHHVQDEEFAQDRDKIRFTAMEPWRLR